MLLEQGHPSVSGSGDWRPKKWMVKFITELAASDKLKVPLKHFSTSLPGFTF